MKKIVISILLALVFLVKGYAQEEKIHYFKLTDKKFKVGSIYISCSFPIPLTTCYPSEIDRVKELDTLNSFLNRNPKLKIEIGCHSDNRKIPMSNDTLTLRRAQYIVDYFIIRGINQNRLIAKGYGANKPR